MKICKEYRDCCDYEQGDLLQYNGKLGYSNKCSKEKIFFCKYCGQIFYDMRPDFGFRIIDINITASNY